MSDSKKKPAKLKTGKWERSLSLARMGLSAGAKAAGYALTNLGTKKSDKESHFNDFLLGQAELVTAELTKLKGSLMKAGQMLSMVGEHFLPKEVNQILAKLRSDSEPAPWSQMERVLKRSLAAEQVAELEIDQEPYAAASVGQVHRAKIIATGEDLCLKIQYPGIEKAIDSDVATLRSILSVSRILPKNIDFEPIFKEVKSMLRRELDYHKELEATEDFQELLKDDPRYLIPKIYHRYSGRRVLATSFMDGLEFNRESAQRLSQDERNHLGRAMLELFFNEFFRWGVVQTDPHFGNYKLSPATDTTPVQLILFDFGAVRKFTTGFIQSYRQFLRGVLYCDRNQFFDAAVRLGFLAEGEKTATVAKFYSFCRLIVEPYILPDEPDHNPKYFLSDGVYNWGASDLASRVATKAGEIFLIFKVRSPDREVVFFDRKVSGVFVAMNVIGPQINARAIIDRYLQDPSS